MQIKHKLMLWFSLLMAAVLLSFSLYVYLTYADFRQRSINERLERKARVTEQLLTLRGTVAGSVIVSLPEQAAFVYSPADSLIYASADRSDYPITDAFRARVRREGLVRFQYGVPGHRHPKDGVAVTYLADPQKLPLRAGARYVAVVTAYDQDGYALQETLRDVVIWGNMAALLLVGLLGYLFSRKALAPLQYLVRQIRSLEARSLRFRLRAQNPHDEVGLLATAFNDLLDQQDALADNQRTFIAQASHELRTPLTTLKGWLETSLTYDSDVDSLKRGIRQAVTELDKLTTLANGLLQLARLDGVDARQAFGPLDLMDVLMDAVDTIQARRPAQRFRLHVSDGVLQRAEPLLLSGNAQLLKTALLNLLENAGKYSDGQPVSITLSMDTESAVRVQVQDQGVGIPADDMNRIFAPLVRGGNVGAVGGFGIGLTLAQRIITRHGGQLQLRSEPGSGTTADVRLPLELLS